MGCGEVAVDRRMVDRSAAERHWRGAGTVWRRRSTAAEGKGRTPVGDNRFVRIVSLVPSATETLIAWGVPPVACTRFCEQPGIPTVGGTKNPDVEAIVRLAPDLVVLDEEENRREDHDALVAAGVPVHVLAIRCVDDVARQLPGFARRIGITWDPPLLGAAMPTRASVVVPIWRRPWMLLGRPTYGESMLAHVGLALRSPSGSGPYPQVKLDEMAALGADLVLAPSEPYPFSERHRTELEVVAPVVLQEGKDLFWWGIRTGPALARLAVLAERIGA